MELKTKKGRPTAEQEAAITEGIIRAATEQFLAKGYEATAIETVAKAAGVYKNAIYRRFSDKEALFRVVMETKVAEWEILADDLEEDHGKTLEQKLQSHLLRLIRWASHPEIQAFRRLRNSLSHEVSGAIQTTALVGRQRMVARIAEDIDKSLSIEGQVASNPEQVALALFSIVQGWIELKLLEGEAVSPQEAETYTAWVVRLVTVGRPAWC